MKSEFEKLNEIYTSITDIDRILKTADDRDKLDNVFNAIKNINRCELDQRIIDDLVIGGIRNALVKIYSETLAEINKTITPNPPTRTIAPETSTKIDINDYYPLGAANDSMIPPKKSDPSTAPLLADVLKEYEVTASIPSSMTIEGKSILIEGTRKLSPIKRINNSVQDRRNE